MKSSVRGFTLVEMLVVIAIIAVLSAIILFSITQYISRGKDSTVKGNLAVLIPAGEAFYNHNSSGYQGFCDTALSTEWQKAYNEMPKPEGWVPRCNVSPFEPYIEWAACSRLFSDNTKSFCVDSQGIKKEILNTQCESLGTQCP